MEKNVKRITRYFLDEGRMNDFYLELCEKYRSVRWGAVDYGESIIATWVVSEE